MRFTSDFFAQHIANWQRWLAPFKGQPVRALEIGSYEGRSACWLMENILTHPDARLVCVDTFKAGQDLPERTDLLAVFRENIWPWEHKILTRVGRSAEVLGVLGSAVDSRPQSQFDFAYIDGSHYAADVLLDATLVWERIKPGGLVIFDDYQWAVDPNPAHQPKLGIDAFMAGLAMDSRPQPQYQLVAKGWQLVLKKSEAEPRLGIRNPRSE